jgi:DNA-binding beta-propeller fold protein YncE
LSKLTVRNLVAAIVLLAVGIRAQEKAPLALVETVPLPGLHDGNFDHFTVDLQGHRLFLTAEDNSAVEVFDLRTSKLVHTISDVKKPHAMVYRADLKKLFVVDGGPGELKIYQSDSYKLIGSIKLMADADSIAYEPSTQYMYVSNSGGDSHMSYSVISVVDTTAEKKLADIKIDSDGLEAMALEKSGPHLFFNMTGKDAVGVIDREKRTLIATWPIGQVAKHNTPMAFDEAHHRLFVGTRNPGKLIVLDSDSGKIVASLPCVSNVDDMVYDPGKKRIYAAGTEFVDVFRENDADHYELIGRIPTAVRAKTAILVPELNRYYVAAPRDGDKIAELRVYKVMP